MVTKVSDPYPIISDLNGTPLENGYTYIGEPGLDPESFPKAVFWDQGLSVPATQPVRTLAGRFVDLGSQIGNLYTDGGYSILVKDKNMVTVFSASNDTDPVLFFDTIADMAEGEFGAGNYVAVWSGFNGEYEIFQYDADSTATADGALIVDATGMGVGRLVSQRKTLVTVPDLLIGDLRGYETYAAGETVKAGGFRYEVAASGATDQHVTTAGGVKLYVLPISYDLVSLEQFGVIYADDDPNYDNSLLIQAAFDNFKEVYQPAGTLRTKIVYWNSNQRHFGVPGLSILERFDNSVSSTPTPNTSMYIAATYAFAQGTADPTENKRDITVEGITFNGRQGEAGFGYQPFSHNVTVNATTNITFRSCEFLDFRGDGIYFGSGTTGGIERHNINAVVEGCLFDGVTLNNRNGISVIDCDGIIVERSEFRNIGNVDLASSVGAIDFEPNATTAVYRDVIIRECLFEDVTTVNTSGITLFNGRQTGDGLNIRNILIENNRFNRCYRGINSSTVPKTLDGFEDRVIIQGNQFLNSILEDVRGNGWKNARILNNTFRLEPINSVDYRGGLSVGTTLSNITHNAIDWVVEGNHFEGLRPQFGCVAIFGARNVAVVRNTFEQINGRSITLVSSATAIGGRYLEDIYIDGNVASGALNLGLYSDSSVTTETARIVRGRWGDNRVRGTTQLIRSSPQVFAGMPATAAPTTGNFDRADFIKDSVPLAGAFGFVCTTPGTGGALTGAVTCDATNGSATITNLVDPNDEIRPGQYITIDGSTYRQIATRDGTTATLALTYAGTTGTGLSVAFSAPVFAVV